MIRLKVETESRWLDLAIATDDGDQTIRVKVRPRTSALDAAVDATALRRVREQQSEAEASAAAGMPLDPDGFTAANQAVLNGMWWQYQVEALALFGIEAWEGIADDAGNPLPVSPAAIAAFAAVPSIAKPFRDAYTASGALVVLEGNASGPISGSATPGAAKPALDAPSDPAAPAATGSSAQPAQPS